MQQPLESMTKRVGLRQLEQVQGDNICLMLNPLEHCDKTFPTQKSSKTLVVDLTLREKGCKPFWNDSCKEISSHLLSPTEIGSAVSASTSLNTSSTGMVVKSWFLTEQKFHHNKNSQRTCCQSYMSSLAECKVLEGTVVKSRKIRIYPTLEQRKALSKWFGIARVAYNSALRKLKDGIKGGWMKVGTDILNDEFFKNDFAKEVPYQVKKLAVKELFSSLTAVRKLKGKTQRGFDMKFRSKKNPRQTICIPKSAISTKGVYHTLLGKMKMKELDQFCGEFSDGKLCLDNGQYFLVITKKVKTEIVDNQDIVGLDPGIRNFLTYFSEQGNFGFLGKGVMKTLHGFQTKLDRLRSVATTTDDKLKRFRFWRKFKKLSHKVKNLVSELHFKVINYLTRTYGVIVMPPFNVKDMINRSKRKIRKVTARAMNCLSFYLFRQRLQHKCRERGILFVEQNESYTSRTNSFTGEVLTSLGSREWIRFGEHKVHRDLNGSRNILLRAMMRDSSSQAAMPVQNCVITSTNPVG